LAQADLDEGRCTYGLTAERQELNRLRREKCDEAAHGRESTIEELEAYDDGSPSVSRAIGVDNWNGLTGTPTPE